MVSLYQNKVIHFIIKKRDIRNVLITLADKLSELQRLRIRFNFLNKHRLHDLNLKAKFST